MVNVARASRYQELVLPAILQNIIGLYGYHTSSTSALYSATDPWGTRHVHDTRIGLSSPAPAAGYCPNFAISRGGNTRVSNIKGRFPPVIVFLVRLHNTKSYLYKLLDKMVLTEYSYVFAIGTFFALLDAYNNGASTSPPSIFTNLPS